MFAASLPDLDSLDLEAAKVLLIAQHSSYTATLSSRSTEIERLVLLVEKLQRMLFGTKSEKVLRQIEQLELQLEELQGVVSENGSQSTLTMFKHRKQRGFVSLHHHPTSFYHSQNSTV